MIKVCTGCKGRKHRLSALCRLSNRKDDPTKFRRTSSQWHMWEQQKRAFLVEESVRRFASELQVDDHI